jgi:RimJ/RimL family protein N-acetyltransferase
MMAAVIISERDGVALAELRDGELDLLRAADDGAFDVDPSDAPSRVKVDVHRLAVRETGSGELLGMVNWHAVTYGRTAHCEAWNIGIGLLPSARGRGVGTTAQRLLVEHLFATTPVDRIEAGTEVDNIPERRALGKAGFRAEGVLRGVALRGGVRRDYVSYGLLRSDVVTGPRVLLAERAGVGIATAIAGDREHVFDLCTSEFDLDPDPRPTPLTPNPSTWLTIMDTKRDAPVGGLSYRVVSYGGSLGCIAWNIGVGLLPDERGRGIGWLAQRLLVEHLFATTELERVEASTDADNVAEQHALEKAGFHREGVARGAQLRGGLRRDVVLYGILRSDLA